MSQQMLVGLAFCEAPHGMATGTPYTCGTDERVSPSICVDCASQTTRIPKSTIARLRRL